MAPSALSCAGYVFAIVCATVAFTLGGIASRLLKFLLPIKVPAAPDALRIGILGAANVNTFGIFLPSRSLSEVKIVIIGARDPQRAKDVARRWGIPRHGDYQTVLRDPEVEVNANLFGASKM